MKSKAHPATDDERLERMQKNAALEEKAPAVRAGLGALLAQPAAIGKIRGEQRAKPVRPRRPRMPGG